MSETLDEEERMALVVTLAEEYDLATLAQALITRATAEGVGVKLKFTAPKPGRKQKTK